MATDDKEIRFHHTIAMPFNPEINNYFSRGGQAGHLMPYQITGWRDEALSWKTGVYLHTMLSGKGRAAVLKGREAQKLLSHAFVNDFSLEKFPIGAGKHVISCAPNGNIGCDGVSLRIAEDTFIMHTREPFVSMYAASGKFDIEPFEPKKTEGIIFQVGGPRSLEVIERAVRADMHDLKFMRYRRAKIAGHDVMILRMGMSGTLGYEIQAQSLAGIDDIYNEITSIGADYDLRVLGRLAYMSNHTENGFPQQGYHFLPDWSDPAIQAYMGPTGSVDGGDFRTVPLRGSLKDEGRAAYHLNPFESGWGHSIRWNHDFVGKESLLKLKDDPNTRKIVTLEWNPRDVVRVFETYFDDEPGAAREMVMPQSLLENPAGNFQDKVIDASGKMIGKSAGRLYTLHYKKMISLGFVHPSHAELGKEVTVIWGEPGTRQIPIRAKVARFPYLDLPPNAKYPIDQIPRYTG